MNSYYLFAPQSLKINKDYKEPSENEESNTHFTECLYKTNIKSPIV